FTNVPPGSYLLQQVVPTGFVSLSPTVLAVTSISGFNNGNNNFLDRSTVVSPTVGTLSGSVLRDNGNGVLDAGDTGLPGATVQLFTATSVFIAQTTTNVNGAYAFANLPPGSYLISQLVPAGYVALTPTVLSATVI